MPYLTGESLPSELVCGRLFIPNDRQLIANIKGAIWQLTKAYNWEQFGAVTVDETVAAMETMFDVFNADTCEDCDTMLRADPENPCILQESTDGGETWATLLNTSDCGAEGPQGPSGDTGLQGPQGPIGDTGETGSIGPAGDTGPAGQSGTTSNNAPVPPGENGDLKRCGVARGVTQWLIEKYGDSLDAFQAGVALGQAVNAIVSGMIDGIPVIGAFIDAALDYGQEIADWDVANLKACVTEEFEDAVFCNLYCHLGDDGVITDEIYTEFMSDCLLMDPCALGITLVGQVFAAMCLAIGAQNVRNRAYIFSAPNDECPPCDECPPDTVTATPVSGLCTIDSPTTIEAGDSFTVHSVNNAGANQYLAVEFNRCVTATVTSYSGWVVNPTETNNPAWRDCGDTDHNTFGGDQPPDYLADNLECKRMYFAGAVTDPFTVVIRIDTLV